MFCCQFFRLFSLFLISPVWMSNHSIISRSRADHDQRDEEPAARFWFSLTCWTGHQTHAHTQHTHTCVCAPTERAQEPSLSVLKLHLLYTPSACLHTCTQTHSYTVHIGRSEGGTRILIIHPIHFLLCLWGFINRDDATVILLRWS